MLQVTQSAGSRPGQPHVIIYVICQPQNRINSVNDAKPRGFLRVYTFFAFGQPSRYPLSAYLLFIALFSSGSENSRNIFYWLLKLNSVDIQYNLRAVLIHEIGF